MAEVGTVTYVDDKPSKLGSVGKMKISWTGTAGGAASGFPIPFNGIITRVVTNPTDGPTANYDVTVLDEDGLDIMQALLANRHTTASEEVTPLIGTTHLVPHKGLINPVVAAAGTSKSGTITIYYV